MSQKYFLAIFTPLSIFTIAIHKIRIKEKLLKDQFGADYSDYMKKTYRLIPWIY